MRSFTRSTFVFVAILYALCGTTPALAQVACAPVARIVSAEGFIAVGAAPGAQSIRVSAGTQADVCAEQTIEAGPRSRAAVLLLASNQVIRLDQNTTITVRAETPQEPRSLIRLLQGFIRLFNPVGRALDVQSPFVTAGTEGTEFFVSYDPQTEDTTTGVIEGLVRVSTPAETIRLMPGEAARARQAGPFQRLNIVPRDAVRWTIFYPAAMWSLPPAEEMALDDDVRQAWQAWSTGDLAAFAMALDRIPRQTPGDTQGRPRDTQSLLRLAALLLVAGQVNEASAAIDRADILSSRASLIPLLRSIAAVIGIQPDQASPLCRAPSSDLAMAAALRAVICVSQNQTDLALTLSERAVATARQANDQSALIGAVIARSYALQAAFRLPEAREVLLTVASSNDPLVLARLAEADLSLGNNRSALREAQQASQLAPSLSLASSILGFSALANFEFSTARTAFERAAMSSPGDPLPHLGLGLVAVRSGDLEAGRREMVTAVALDPENSVARSYLGKTYASLRLYEGAFREWMLAEAADPRDPTAPLYRAFAERALNRPAEALSDLEKSIGLNDNRAVYRSRLLLDQDLATRTAGLASVYRDLGFDQLALTEGYKAVNSDPTNPGAHRFLSDTYLAIPGHNTASDSELLQSLLLQPLNTEPLRPRLAREGLGVLELQGPSRIGFNEFSPIFASDGFTVLGDAFGGTQGTYGDNLVLSGIKRNFSFSAGQFYYRTDGFRPNNDIRRDIENAFVQTALSDRASIFVEYRHFSETSGDTAFLFDPNSFSDSVRETADLSHYRVGGRFDVAPGVTAVGVYTHENLSDALSDPDVAALKDRRPGDFGEAAGYFSVGRFNIVAGGGYFAGSSTVTIIVPGLPFPLIDHTSDTHANAWVYVNSSPIDGLNLTLGGSFDSYRGTLDHDRISPKVGLSWSILPALTVRAAYFETVKRSFVGGQTIEPTEIVGFNQLYDDVNLAKTRRWGVGLDAKLNSRLFAGIEWSRRHLDIPIGPTPFGATSSHTILRSYLDWITSDRISLNAAAQWEKLVGDPTALSFFQDLDVFKLPIQLRYYDPSGLFALLGATYVYETGNFSTFSGTPLKGDENFSVVDAGIGWRFPGRGLIAGLQITNLFNSGFRFQDTTINRPTLFPHRVIWGRLTFMF